MPLTLTAPRPRVRVPAPPPAKRVLDLVGAVVLLTALALPLAAVTALLYATTGGHPFVREAAAGL
ncbi:sugar transferase, partial [Streptomyces virginiae]